MASLPLFQSPDDPAATPLWTVSELTAQIKLVLESGFAGVGVRGEVSNVFRHKTMGHVFFDLKEGKKAKLRAVLWREDARRLVFELENGLAVRAFGDIDVYPPSGEYKLTVFQIEPEGTGPLELALRQLMERLAAEGLFDESRKRPLPEFPDRIVVATSPSGAAVRDVLQVVGRRWPAAEVLIAPAKVQGPGAAGELAAAIALANRLADADLIILARGGGSLEDLWAFNEEVLARAIFDSRLPVVSAVGHEIDVTIADLVADCRAPTPSAAGELCVPDARAVSDRLDALGDRLARAALDRIGRARSELERLSDRARRALARGLDDRRRDLARLAAQLDALSPLAVLARGYSLTLQDGATLRDAADARPGDLIRTRLARGSIVSRVLEIIDE